MTLTLIKDQSRRNGFDYDRLYLLLLYVQMEKSPINTLYFLLNVYVSLN